MNEELLFKLLKQALLGEVATTIGRINLVFGAIAVAMMIALLADSAIEKIGDFLLRLLGKQGRPTSDSDKKLAIVSVIVFFVISLVIVALTTAVGK
jgi:hypothetical protein